MQSDLEKYLKSKRQQLDVEQPDDMLIWEGIRKDIQETGKRSTSKKTWIRLWNVAAVIIILLSLTYVLNDLISDQGIRPGIKLAKLDQKLGDREKEYIDLVNYREKEIKSFKTSDNLIIEELMDEIKKLDEIYLESMHDLEELGYDERVINTIFNTYEQKIFLLELIILENSKMKNNETNTQIYL